MGLTHHTLPLQSTSAPQHISFALLGLICKLYSESNINSIQGHTIGQNMTSKSQPQTKINLSFQLDLLCHMDLGDKGVGNPT